MPDLSYTRVNWQDEPSRLTPLNAANLNTMDTAIAALVDYYGQLTTALEALEGRVAALEAQEEVLTASALSLAGRVTALEQGQNDEFSSDGDVSGVNEGE